MEADTSLRTLLNYQTLPRVARLHAPRPNEGGGGRLQGVVPEVAELLDDLLAVTELAASLGALSVSDTDAPR
jgi:hypothetical protein